MSYENLVAHIERSPARISYAVKNIRVDGFMSELSSLVRGRLDHVELDEKWKWTQAARKLEAFENRNKIKSYAQLRLHEGVDRCDLQEQIIAGYLLPQVGETQSGSEYDPYDRLWADSPAMNMKPLSDLVLSKMASGVFGYKVADVAWEHKMDPEQVKEQLRSYVEKQGLERADEVAQGRVGKKSFEHSISMLPETFFDLSPYKPRLKDAGDCSMIALAVSEDKTYSAAVAAVSDIMQGSGGVRGIDFHEYLTDNGFVSEPFDTGISLENLWNSELITVQDSGVITVSHAGEGSHAIGFREGRMYVPDAILVSQLYASSEVVGVYLRKSHTEVAVKRAAQRVADAIPLKGPESIHEDVDLEALKERLVVEIMSKLSGVEQINEVVR